MWGDDKHLQKLKQDEPPLWPDDLPDAADSKRLKKQQANSPWDAPKGKKEKTPATWGIPPAAKNKGASKSPTEYAPVDKAALKRQVADAKWAEREQRAIAKAYERQAKAARRARDWQATADREIAEANRRGYAVDYPAAEPSGCLPGGECLSGCATIPVWLIILLVLILLVAAWIN